MSKFNELINGDQPVLVDFYADWCGPCKAMAPVLKEFKSDMGDAVKVIKVDVDRNQQAANNYSVRGVPTFILFKKGQQLWRHSGMVSKAQLEQVVRQNS